MSSAPLRKPVVAQDSNVTDEFPDFYFEEFDVNDPRNADIVDEIMSDLERSDVRDAQTHAAPFLADRARQA